MGLELTKFQANGRCVTKKSFHKFGSIHDLEASQENRLTLTAHFFSSHQKSLIRFATKRKTCIYQRFMLTSGMRKVYLTHPCT